MPAAVAGITGLVLLACWPSVRALVPVWNGETYGTYVHGWLVLAVSIWLMWRQRAALRAAAWRPYPLAWAGVGVATLCYVAGLLLHFKSVQQGSIPLLVLTTTWAALGYQVVRLCLFPIGYLYFAIPVWIINAPLVWLCVQVERLLLWVSGIPSTVSGTDIRIPEGVLEIESGCNGLHFLIVATAIAALLGYLERLPVARRVQMIALAAGMAFVANTVRIHSLFLIAHETNMTSGLITSHHTYGLVIFAVAMSVFFVLVRAGRMAEAR
jgi:exosortase